MLTCALMRRREGEDARITEFRETMVTKNTHLCLAGACRPEGWKLSACNLPDCNCRKKFPFEPHFGPPVEDASQRCWLYYRPSIEFQWISTTTAATALSWGGAYFGGVCHCVSQGGILQATPTFRS